MAHNADESRIIQITANTTAQERQTIQALLSGQDLGLIVIDALFDGSSLGLHLIRRADDLESKLSALPVHEEGLARIFDYSYNFDKDHLEQLELYIKNVYQESREVSCSPPEYETLPYDLDAIVSQWNSDVPLWLKADGLAQRFWSDISRYGIRSSYLKSMPMERNRLLILHKASEQIVISNYPLFQQSSSSCFLAKSLLGMNTSILMVDGTRTHFAKLLVLDFLQGCLLGWIGSIINLLNPYATHYLEEDWPLRDGRPPGSEVIKEYVKNFLNYERIMERCQDLVDAIEFTVQILEARDDNHTSLSTNQNIRENMVCIRLRCAQLMKLISRSLNRRDQRYNLFVKTLNIEDSVSIKRLTILAAIFLPCSLACGILSMQTRFFALHLLLYDFLGVFILVASFAVIVYFVLRIFTELSRRDHSWVNRKYAPWKVYWWSSKADDAESEFGSRLFMIYATVFFVWAIVVVSFVVGMVLDVKLGLKVLRYGFAGLVGICALFFFLLY